MIKVKVGSFIREVDLSQKQFDVLREMYVNEAFLVTNEGSNYRAWLQKGVLKSETQVRTSTANILYAGGWVKQSKKQHPACSNWFYYELSPKALKLFYDMT